MPGKHAILSPSHAHTWAGCPASAWLEKGVPNPSSPYAEEGTKAHSLAERTLRQMFEDAPCTPEDIRFSEGCGREMGEHVGEYVRFVAERIAEAKKADECAYIAFEHPVDVSPVTSEEGAKGTIDCLLAYPGHLWVIDLKYGAGVPVSAERNEQLSIYAAALWDEVSLLYDDIEHVHLAIVQPRAGGVNQWELTPEQLEAFKANVRPRAEKAIRFYNEEEKPTVGPDDYCCNESVCRWCRGKAKCPMLAEQAASAALVDYKADEPKPEAVQVIRVPDDPEKLAKAYSLLPALETFTKMVRESVTARLGQGEKIPGYKLVAGRKGPRKWADDAQVEKLMKSMRLKREEMYDFKLISPTKFEAALKANPKLLGTQQQQKIRDCVTQSEGKPSVVEESDKRPAITAASSADFEAIEN